MSPENLDALLRRLDRRVSGAALFATGAFLLAANWMAGSWLEAHGEAARDERVAAAVAREDLDLELGERAALRDLVARDLERAKASASKLTRSRRVLFEGGLALTEEKRLLEKQWEIMTTFLLLDEGADKVSVMRGEQAFESWPLGGVRARVVAGEKRSLPKDPVAIYSKERFAHPERGVSEQKDGQLRWEPPQVGESVRANALGEFVMFARGGLVVHGPPLKSPEHEAFPHLCLSLPRLLAARLYSRSFVGTKVWRKPAAKP